MMAARTVVKTMKALTGGLLMMLLAANINGDAVESDVVVAHFGQTPIYAGVWR